jgi:hypothetical protein
MIILDVLVAELKKHGLTPRVSSAGLRALLGTMFAAGAPESWLRSAFECDSRRAATRRELRKPGLFSIRRVPLWSAVACYRFWSGSLLPSHSAAPPGERLPHVGESLGFGRRQQATSAKRRQAARTPKSLRDSEMALLRKRGMQERRERGANGSVQAGSEGLTRGEW